MSGIFSTGVFHGVSDRYDILASKRIAGEDLLYRTGENERPVKTDIDLLDYLLEMHVY